MKPERAVDVFVDKISSQIYQFQQPRGSARLERVVQDQEFESSRPDFIPFFSALRLRLLLNDLARFSAIFDISFAGGCIPYSASGLSCLVLKCAVTLEAR